MTSVVIATWRRRAVLTRTLPTILGQDFPRDRYEIVVVVDGPDEDTLGWLRTLKVNGTLTIVEQPHRGLAAARNSGIAAARGETVLLLDDDLICSPQLLQHHASAARDRVVAFGPVLVSDESPRTIAAEWVRRVTQARAMRLSASGPEWPSDIALCANYSAPRKLILSCGGFDESLMGACEEFDMGIRLRRSGAEFRYLPEAVTHEIYVKSAKQMALGDTRARGRNEVRLCRKYPEYRSVSPVAHFMSGSRWMRIARTAAVRSPVSPELFLGPAFAAAQFFKSLPLARRIAFRLLEFRRGAAFFRAARDEAGSWPAFLRELAVNVPAEAGGSGPVRRTLPVGESE